MTLKFFTQRNPRIEVLFAVVLLLFIVLLSGLAWRQLGSYLHFQEREQRQNLRQLIKPAPRGRILDRNGVVLVDNHPRFSAVVLLEDLRLEFDRERASIQNALVEEHEETGEPLEIDHDEIVWESRRRVLQRYLDEINSILGISAQLNIRAMKDQFVYRILMPFPLVTDLGPAHYAQLLNRLPIGSRIQIYTDTTRAYPNGSVAAHTLGYVKSTADLDKLGFANTSGLKSYAYPGTLGVNGLEKAFDEQLRGSPGIETIVVDRFGFPYETLLARSTPPVRGTDLRTTLDLKAQRKAEEALAGKVGAVVMLDVNSGEVLVLASKPDYDLNVFTPRLSHDAAADINERKAWLNRAVQGAYPPGSTFKMVSAIAAMRAGVIGPYDKIPCGTHFRIGPRLYPEHSGAAFGPVDLPFALMKSSNVYIYQIALKTGIDRIADEARRFGLHQQTGIELPFETSRMQVPDRQWSKAVRGYGWMPGDTANVAIGQGDLLASPLQMAAFTASLARRETRTNVTLIHDEDRIPGHEAEPIGLTDTQYKALVEGMVRAAGPGGTARFIGVRGLAIAAKTGTAQVKIPGRRLTLAWTVAFAPVDTPEVAISVLVEGQNPDDNYAGGGTAAPIAQVVLDQWFRQRKTVAGLIGNPN